MRRAAWLAPKPSDRFIGNFSRTGLACDVGDDSREISETVHRAMSPRRSPSSDSQELTRSASEGVGCSEWLGRLPGLLEELRPFLHNESRRYGISELEAQDLVQSLALLAIQNAERIREPASWLCGTFRNLCRMEVRRRLRWRSACSVLDDPDREGEADGGDRDAPIEVQQRLARLSARSRRALELHYVEGLTLEETAARLGFALKSMKRTLHRALRSARIGSPRR